MVEQARHDSELRLQMALDATGDGLWDWNTETGQAYLSPSYYALTGYRPDDVEANFDFFKRLVHPEDFPGVMATIEAHMRGETSVSDVEYRMVTASGEIRRIRGRGRVVARNDKGVPLRMVGHITDITDQLRLVDDLRLAQNTIQMIQEAAHVGTWNWDLRTGEVSWSPELERMYGFACGEFPGSYRAFAECVHPDDLPEVERQTNEAVAARRRFAVDFRVVLPSGEIRWVFSKGAASYDAAGAPERIFGVNIDVTERRRAEEASRESEARFRAVVQDQTELIVRFRADGIFIFANEVYCQFFGVNPETIVGKKWQPLAYADDLPMIEQRLTELSPDNPVVVIENRVYSAAGDIRWMQFVNRAFYDAQGTLTEIQAVGRDITERKQSEARQEALLQENIFLGRELIRLQEKERRDLARELHDELSQQIAAIRAFAAAIERGAGRNKEKLLADVAAIDESARHIYTVSHRIMEGLHPHILDSGGLVEGLRVWFAGWQEKNPGFHVIGRLAEDIGSIDGEITINLFRIVQEFMVNVAAHSGARTVRVFLRERRIGGQRWLRLVIRDNGRGMELDSPRRGYGLIVMRERAHGIGARFDLSSQPGQGVRVTVDVPRPD